MKLPASGFANSVPGPGDSGAWVISESSFKVLGVIYAYSASRKLAYLIPAKTFFGSIYNRWRNAANLSSIEAMFSPHVEQSDIPSQESAAEAESSTSSRLSIPSRSVFSQSTAPTSVTSVSETEFLRALGFAADEREFSMIVYGAWNRCQEFLTKLGSGSISQALDRKQRKHWQERFRDAATQAQKRGQSAMVRRLAERIAMLQMMDYDEDNSSDMLTAAFQGAVKDELSPLEKKAMAELDRRRDDIEKELKN